MLNKLYYWLHRLTSKRSEQNEYSAGYWQDIIRQSALKLCDGVKGRLLEIGCGEGLFLTQLGLQSKELEIFGIDNNAIRLQQAEERLRKNGLENTHLILREAPNLDLPDEYFDIVVCVNVFFNMPSTQMVWQTMAQIRRVLKKDGRVIFDFRNSLNPLLILKYRLARFYDETVKGLPLNTYSPKEIDLILRENGFKISRSIAILKFFFRFLSPVFLVEARKL